MHSRPRPRCLRATAPFAALDRGLAGTRLLLRSHGSSTKSCIHTRRVYFLLEAEPVWIAVSPAQILSWAVKKMAHFTCTRSPRATIFLHTMIRHKVLFTSTLLALVVSHSVIAQETKKYNGFWSGKYTCSENISADAKAKPAYASNIIFNVDNSKGTAKTSSKQTVEKFNLTISSTASVAIESNGNSTNDPARRWSIRAYGSVVGNKLKADGSMYGSDGAVVREKCTFLLANDEMTFTPVVEKAPKAPPAKAAEPASPPASTPKAVTTPAPTPVAATPTAPARTAAIANVAPPAAGQSTQIKKVTTNSLDSQKKTSPNDVWINFNPAVTVQERQFCRVVENFRTEYAVAGTTRNQIKLNETLRGLTQSLNSLLPDGKFQGWVMRTVGISQAKDGSAEVLLELPCGVYVGSNTCDADPKNFYGTAPEGSRIYSELAKMTVGDFALVSGQFVYADETAFNKDRSVASFKYMKTADHCKAKSLVANADFFGLKLEVLSTIK